MREYEIKIEIGSATVPITVKTACVKGISMRFDGVSFIITAPESNTEEEARQFAEKHVRWIKNRYKPAGEGYGDIKNIVTYLGKNYRLIISDGSPGVVISDDEIIVFAPDKDREEAKKIFIKFWKEEAKKFFTAKTERFYKQFGRYLCIPSMPEVKIVKVNSYWGQCVSGKRRIIKYNMYALQFDERYCDYLVCHELTHFRHHDHGKKFHATLNKIFPNEKETGKKKKERQTKMWFDFQ